MRTVNIITTPVNNVGNKIEIEGYGTTSFIMFAQILYNAGLIEYKRYIKAKKTVFDIEFCTKVVNENPNLFPINF